MDVMIPKNFNVACRRPTPGNGYLEALAGEKTTVFTDSIKAITPTGVVDSATGTEHPVDVIICATGFDTSYRPRFPITGLDPNATLTDKWSKFPASYLGIGVDGYPNFFCIFWPFHARSTGLGPAYHLSFDETFPRDHHENAQAAHPTHESQSFRRQGFCRARSYVPPAYMLGGPVHKLV